MSSLSSFVPCSGTTRPAVALILFRHSGTSGATAFHIVGTTVVTFPFVPAAGIVIAGNPTTTAAATSILTASAGQQQQDNQTIHILCFLSTIVTLSYASQWLMFLVCLSVFPTKQGDASGGQAHWLPLLREIDLPPCLLCT